jgi:hypothetical protein
LTISSVEQITLLISTSFESKMRTTVEHVPSCGCSAGKEASGCPSSTHEDRPVRPVHRHVELGQPGPYRLRVLDPDSGVTSKPFVLVIEGEPRLYISYESPRAASSLAKTTTLSRYLCLAES